MGQDSEQKDTNIESRVSVLEHDFGNLEKSQDDMKRTNWKLLALTVTLLVGLLAACQTMVFRHADKQSAATEEAQKTANDALRKAEKAEAVLPFIRESLNRIERKLDTKKP